MKILVTGGTGNVGGAVVKELLKRKANVRVLARKQPEEGKLPAGVEPGHNRNAYQGGLRMWETDPSTRRPKWNVI